MPKDWKEISDDELLNFNGPQTAEIARYQRIMEQKTFTALMEVRAGLFDVKRSMHVVTDKLVDRFVEFEKTQKDAAASQRVLQGVAIALTIVIALSTVVYTWITWQTVQAQREANQIQREALASKAPPVAIMPSNPTVERDAPKAARPSP